VKPALNRIILYTGKMDEMIGFYARHFGYREQRLDGDRIVELVPPEGGAILMLHPAAKGQKQGQSLVKLVFDVSDVPAALQALKDGGVETGPVHQADGYAFANFKDPSGNPVSISSRAFRGAPP
jgi:predicted enzyme related to lactoylglutathione lyase